MLTLNKQIAELSRAGIKFKKIITETQDVCIEFKNAKGNKISHLFDSANSANPLKESKLLSADKDTYIKRTYQELSHIPESSNEAVEKSIGRKFADRLSPTVINAQMQKRQGGKLVDAYDRTMTYSSPVNGGKILEVTPVKSLGGEGLPSQNSKPLNLRMLYDDYMGMSKSQIVKLMRTCGFI